MKIMQIAVSAVDKIKQQDLIRIKTPHAGGRTKSLAAYRARPSCIEEKANVVSSWMLLASP